jgi:hypothetical protein
MDHPHEAGDDEVGWEFNAGRGGKSLARGCAPLGGRVKPGHGEVEVRAVQPGFWNDVRCARSLLSVGAPGTHRQKYWRMVGNYPAAKLLTDRIQM